MGLINGIFANHFDQLNMITSFIITPLIYLGGVFYNIHKLPPFWEKLSLINPVAYMINLLRHTLIGFPIPNIGRAYAALSIIIVLLFLFTRYLINKGVRIKT